MCCLGVSRDNLTLPHTISWPDPVLLLVGWARPVPGSCLWGGVSLELALSRRREDAAAAHESGGQLAGRKLSLKAPAGGRPCLVLLAVCCGGGSAP